MKKQFLILAGSAILLASCGSNNTTPPAPTQAQMDSAMNAKLAEHDAANAAKNDSTLRAIEKEKADAEAAKKNTSHTGGKKDEHKAPAPAPTPTVAPATIGNGKPNMGDHSQTSDANKQNNGNTIGNGKPKMGGK